MSVIKKFFEKKKHDAKFKMAGPGHKLTEEHRAAAAAAHASGGGPSNSKRTPPAGSAVSAGAAALARFEQQKQNQQSAESTMANRSMNVIKAEARKELQREKEEQEKAMLLAKGPKEIVQESPPVLATAGVYFYCPLVGPDVLSRLEIESKIREFLYEQLEEEKGLTSCLIIHTCNKPRDRVSQCVDILCKYIDNIVQNPTEEKYRKIRCANKVFQDKVRALEGTQEFLEAAGFELKHMSATDTADPEDFYVYPESLLPEIDQLKLLRDAIQTAEPLKPELDRGVRVLRISSVFSHKIELPNDFYSVSKDELKREHQHKLEDVEKNQMLRTKAMRERGEIKSICRYNYALVRIKLPDDMVLQGTFEVDEPFSAVTSFVRESLANQEAVFMLSSATNHRLSDEESQNMTLDQLDLVPAAIIHFSWDIVANSKETLYYLGQTYCLREELLAMVQDV